MGSGSSVLEARLRAIALFILVVGLASSVLIYFIAEDATSDALRYQSESDNIGVASPQDSKRYVREMEQFGGGINMLAFRFRIWFSGLWQGKSLAYPIAFIAIITAYILRFIAARVGPLPGESGEKEK